MSREFSAPSPLVTGQKAAVFAGGSAGTFAVTDVAAIDKILYVESHVSFVTAASGISGDILTPLVGLGDAYTRLPSQSSASVVAAGVVGLDYSTASYFNIVHYIDADSGATTY